MKITTIHSSSAAVAVAHLAQWILPARCCAGCPAPSTSALPGAAALPRPAMSATAPQVSRIAAARRAELDEIRWVNPNAHAPAPGGAAAAAAFPTHPLDSSLAALGQLPAVLAEPEAMNPCDT